MSSSTHTEQPTTALITIGPSSLSQLPEPVQAILAHYQVSDAPDLTEHLAHILALDRGISEQDPRLPGIRQEQVAALTPIISDVRRAAVENEFFLGFLLLNAYTRHLHTYSGYGEFQQWCTDLGVSRALVKRTTTRAKVWPYLYSLGYVLSDLMEPGFDEEKLGDILSMHKRETREIQERQRELLLSTHVELVDDLSGDGDSDGEEHPNAASRKLRKALSQLPQEEQQEIIAASHEDYRAQMRAEIERIRQTPIEDYIREKNARIGKPDPLYAAFAVEWHQGYLSFSATSCVCEFAQVAAMIKNQANFRFIVEGEPGEKTLSELGEYLAIAHVERPRSAPAYHTQDDELDDF